MEEHNMGGSGSKSPDNKTVMGVLAYLGPLLIVSYLVDREDPFVKFHIGQGLVLFVIEVAVWFFSSLLFSLILFREIVGLVILVLIIIGIMNVLGGKERELPLVGRFAKYFPI